MPTLSDLIERTRVAMADRATRDSLSVASGVDANIDFTVGAKITEGARLSIDLETIYVLSKNSATQAVTVRGQEGTTNVDHLSGSTVHVNPRHTASEYRQAINNALDSISSAFGNLMWDYTGAFSSARLIPLPGAAIRAFAVMRVPTGGGRLKPVPFSNVFRAPLDLAPSGKAVQLVGYNPGSGTAYIGYEAAWPHLTNPTDQLDGNYPLEAEDVITLGAQAYLIILPEVFRRLAFEQPHGKVDERMASAGELIGAKRDVLGHFLTRRNELAAHLRPERNAWIHA